MLGPLPPTVGGITSFMSGLMDSNLCKKYDLEFFGTERPTVGITKNVSDYTVVLQIGFFALAKSIFLTMSHVLSFPLVLLRKRSDIVHINTASYWSFWENAFYLLVSRAFSRKTILHIHGGGFKEFYQDSNCFSKFLIRKTLGLSHEVIVLSPSWGKFLEGLLAKDRIAVIENFVDLSQFHTYVRKYDASKRPITVLFVGGTAAKEKGLYDIINAIPLVLEQYRDILFVFVACSSISELRIFSEKEPMASHTRLLGYLHGDEKLQIFFESDIFILPSYGEGLPITILEAMATGLPVIATSVGAIPEVIEDGKNGFLIEVGDYMDLAKKILTLARDIKLRQEIGKNNLKKIERQYNKDLIVSKLSAEYDELSAENCGLPNSYNILPDP
jgi:glycosyltransferase involved in cell wall biosynthesis